MSTIRFRNVHSSRWLRSIGAARWTGYLRYARSYRDPEKLMAERNQQQVDHVTIWSWVQRYALELDKRCRRELRRTNASWRVDETYLPVPGIETVHLIRKVR